MVLFLGLAGLVAFLTTWLLLRQHVDLMALRYPIAVAAGYATLLALLGIWRHVDLTPEANEDSVEAGFDTALDAADSSHVFSTSPSDKSGSSWGELTAEGDEVMVLIIVAALALVALATCAYVVWNAPTLFAELLADGAIVAGGYRRMKRRARREPEDWLSISVRRTWVPAAVLAAFSAAGGFALDQLTEHAQTMGEAIAEVMSTD